jgi:hypothetical protein
MATLALYTTVYPGVERYLADWYRSLRRQTDLDCQLWVGLDTVGVESAKEAMGGDPDAIWVPGRNGESPAMIRQRALAQIVEGHDAVVLVDSDDIMHSTRIATAREMLRANDLVGCALRLVDERGSSMDMTFTLPPNMTPEDAFPRSNAFGLSNTALRSDVLRRCLPIPAAVALVDWFLFTRAWLLGTRLAFGARVEMDYRQHCANTARVLAPFHEQQVVQDTERVRQHFRLVRASPLEGALPYRLAELERAAADVEVFYERVVLRPALLARYLQALNEQNTPSLWWSWVADPLLRHLWTTEKEVA